jgi:glutaredoxin-like protein
MLLVSGAWRANPFWRFDMAMIQPKDVDRLKKEFATRLSGPVRLVMATQETECQYCRDTRQIVEELAALSDKISAEIYDFMADKAHIEPYGLDKIPAIAIIGAKDYGVRFYGIPSGYEFSSLVETIIAVSKGQATLAEPTRKALDQLDEDVRIQVFVTPT